VAVCDGVARFFVTVYGGFFLLSVTVWGREGCHFLPPYTSTFLSVRASQKYSGFLK